MNFKLDPIKRFALFLTIFSGFALGYNWSTDVLVHLASTVGFALVLFALYSKVSSKHKNVWDSLITGEIIFLLMHYGEGLSAVIYPMIAVFIAETLKFFIEWKSSPIVNPAAAGLLLTAGLSAIIGWELPFVSWWGASFWVLPIGVSVSLILIAIWVLGGFHVWRKWPIFFSFLLVSAIVLYLRTKDPSALSFTYLDSTIYFFAAIMLPEPKTSPFLPWKQVVYGALAALLLNGLGAYGVPYAELFALIGANLLNAGFKWKTGPKLAPAA